MAEYVSTEHGKKHLAHMTARAAELNRKHAPKPKPKPRVVDPAKRLKIGGVVTPYGILVRVMRGAMHRCNNEQGNCYENYGGRGIEFRFADQYAAADWVLANIGYRPGDEYSIDRIDNNRHYEPGNLRWATAKQQNRNKRQYKKREIGYHIERLMQQGCAFSYETIRSWIKQGLSDEEILTRKHSGAGRPRKR